MWAHFGIGSLAFVWIYEMREVSISDNIGVGAEWMQGHEIWTQCGSLGAGRPFVVCNDQLLHF